MEGRKENKYNLSGICPECGKLIKLELVVATELVEHTDAKELEAKVNAGKREAEGREAVGEESGDVRPADATPTTGEPGPGPAAADSGKGKRAKKAGGK